MDWSNLTETELLQAYAGLMEHLRLRGIVRSSNNPVGDFTEFLVQSALGLTAQGAATAGYDATDRQGKRYQIKGRRLTTHNKSTQLSAIRNLNNHPFDFLVAVMYSTDFSVLYSGKIPLIVVQEFSRYQAHPNAHRFLFKRDILDDRRVEDITDRLRRAQQLR